MAEIIILNEEYLANYYAKRKELNKLQYEVETMSRNIKAVLLENHKPTGYTYGSYVASLSSTKKLNNNFIQLLKNLNMQHKIVESAYVKDCKEIIDNFTKEDREKYFDERSKNLVVKKIK